MTNNSKKNLQKVSRLLAKVLRHAPEELGLTLDANGWIAADVLRDALAAKGLGITAEELTVIVQTSDKKRFTLTEDGSRIRAAQGHSVEVDLGIPPSTPPAVLYHGTAVKNLLSIRQEGLLAGNRQQVHLSADRETALRVGTRHGSPIILTVDARAMQETGEIAFYQAENGVWLTDYVAPKYLAPLQLDEQEANE